jgi:predicted  nucleic acid-binding Zn-ribbon protein
MKKLERDLEKARAEVDKTQRENADLAKQLEDAMKAREASQKKQQTLESRAAAAEEALVKVKSTGKAESDQARELAKSWWWSGSSFAT